MLNSPILHAFGNSIIFADVNTNIAKTPGVIIGPIANILGAICNFLYTFVAGIFSSGTLGITIILFTLVVRVLLLPFAAYSQKSMSKMREIQPEMKKIQDKYKGKTDVESKKRMQAEISEVQRKSGANPMLGCLPLLLQMPIIYALFFILQRVYLYIDTIGQLYKEIADVILQYSDIGPLISHIVATVPSLKKFVEKDAFFDLSFGDNAREVASHISSANWEWLISHFPQDLVVQLRPLLEQKANIEYFLGINLVERPEIFAISIIIPILSGLSTFASTWLMNKAQGKPADEQTKMQQRMMLISMPIIMGVMAFSLPAGLGLYWTVGNVFQIGQQYVFNKMYKPKSV